MLTPRSLILGLAASAAVVFIVSWAELVTGQIMIGFLQLPPVVLALLFLVVLINRWAARWPGRALGRQELAVIHVMMLVAAMISSRGLMEKLLPTLVGQNYFADATNNWAGLFFPHIKGWMVPWDTAKGAKQWLVVRFFEGLRAGEGVPWAAWTGPLLAWTLLVLAVFWAYLCMATILRRQWSDNEKLSFPLAQLPVELIRDTGAGTLGPLFWLGFAFPAALFTLNGLHNLFPNVPGFTTDLDLKVLFAVRPWSQLDYFTLYFSPAAVGFFFLLPTELLFSLWFFYLLGIGEQVGFVTFGAEPSMSGHGGAMQVAGQATGAWLALAGYLAVVAWPHLKRVGRAAISQRESSAYSAGELMSYRAAVWGLAGAFVLILAWAVAAGMALWLALIEFGVFLFVQALIMARSTCEGGMLMTEGCFTPVDLVTGAVDRNLLGAGNLTALSFMDAMFTRDLRGLLLTGFLDGQKVADGVGLVRRRLLAVFVVAVLASMLMAGGLQLWLPYHRGAINMYTYPYTGNDIQFFRENAPALRRWVPATWSFLGWTAFLGWMRTRFFWWPLHPLGYALSATWTSQVFWFPILVAWICKASISRYGGMRAYTRVRPFFLGMVLGEFVTAMAWTFIAMLTNAPSPTFPWP